MTGFNAYVAIFVYGNAIATVCLAAVATKSGAVIQILDTTSSTEARLHLLLHNYRPPVWAILGILWINGMFLAVLSIISLSGNGCIVSMVGQGPVWFTAVVSFILIISAVVFTKTGISEFHDTRKIAALPFARLLPFLPACIERKFGEPD